MKIAATLKKRRGLRLTAMIDIIFLLLIFFILVTRFQHQQSLPLIVHDSTAATTSPVLTITLMDNNTLKINDQSLTIAELADYLSGHPQDKKALLIVGDKASLQSLLTVMDTLHGGGIHPIALQTP